jgi:heme o synthase
VVLDFVSLAKPRLSALVLFTTAGGVWLAKEPLPLSVWLMTLVGTAGTVAAANAFNCAMERDSDRFMRRTAGRPLPAGRMELGPACVFALLLGAVSLPMLWLGSNWLTGLLGTVALITYVLIYTPLKSRTHWAMEVGAVSGALPPLMGWTAARGRIELPGVILFLILYLWQLPHFIAIAMVRKTEYRAAGLTSLPLAWGDEVARRVAVVALVALLLVSLGPVMVGMSGGLYLVAAVILGLAFLGEGVRGLLRRGDERWAKRLFGASLAHLTLLFLALGIDQALFR